MMYPWKDCALAIFSTVVTVHFIVYWMEKHVLAAIYLFLALIFLIKGPFYQMHDVQKPGSRIVETVGMPIVIMGNVEKARRNWILKHVSFI